LRILDRYWLVPDLVVREIIDKALEFTDGRKPEKLMYSKKYMINRL